ncbi:MAG TPA: hypothetical protein VGB02_06585 [Pyrinomonadaceae bacterium]|jgi:hypothetical protein
MQDYEIDYAGLFSQISDADMETKIAFLAEELPHDFHEQYLLMTPRITNLCRYFFKKFEYIYDDYSQLEVTGVVPYSPTIESRVVGVLGRSQPTSEKRDASRLKGWVGQTGKYFGENTDKGHFIAHTIGGGLEVNIFAQRRDINQGRSTRGKIFRSMEKYCARHPNTFCFNRPLYSEDTSRPYMIEFGVLLESGELWVERFDN